MATKEIKIACSGGGRIGYKFLIPFQGNLKSLSEENFQKLKRSILENGFTSPIHVWQAKGTKEFYNLDGHQRCRVLEKLEAEGYEIPQIPINFIEAPNKDKAKKILLTHASSYGKVESDGLYEFICQSTVEPEYVRDYAHFHELSYKRFDDEFYDKPSGVEESASENMEGDSEVKKDQIWMLGKNYLKVADAKAAKSLIQTWQQQTGQRATIAVDTKVS